MKGGDVLLAAEVGRVICKNLVRLKLTSTLEEKCNVRLQSGADPCNLITTANCKSTDSVSFEVKLMKR